MGEFSDMDALEALKFLEQGTDDVDDNEIINRAITEIESLRAALQFYAASENWEPTVTENAVMDRDEGRLARDVLNR